MQRRDSSSKPHERAVSAEPYKYPGSVTQPPPTVPLVFVPEIQAQDRQQGTKDSAYWPITPEWALVYVTGFLMFYTARLWRETKRLAADAAKTAIGAKEDSDKTRIVMTAQQAAMEAQEQRMKESVAAMERQEALISRQLAVMEQQGKTMQESVELANTEFVAANPPDLTVTGFKFGEAQTDEGGTTAKLSFTIVNKGNTPARIVEYSFTTFPLLSGSSGLPSEPPYADAENARPLAGTTILRGHEYRQTLPADNLSFVGTLRQVRPSTQTMIVLGWIRFQDRQLSYRKFGFCYELPGAGNRWIQAGGVEYNYTY
jgi:hypothetical protein